MDNMTPLSMDDMEKVNGGSSRTIQSRGAQVRLGPGLAYNVVGSLSGGTVVNFTGTVSYNDQDGKSWYLISAPMYGWVTKNELGV